MPRFSKLAFFFISLFCLLSVSYSSLHAQRHTLSNGLEVYLQPDTTRALVHVAITLRGGPLLDLPDADGLANYYSYLLTDRSDSLPGDGQLATQLRPRGILRSQATYEESNFFSISMDSTELDRGLELLATVIQYPGFDSSSLARTRPQLARDLQAIAQSPQYYHMTAMRSALWDQQAYRKNLPGNYAQLAALNAAWIQAHFADFLHPRHALLTATGNVSPDDFFQRCEQLFGQWKTNVPPGNLPPFAPQALKESVYFVTENAFASFPILTMAWPTAGLLNAPSAPDQLAILATVAGLRRSKFYRALVGKGLAQHVQWSYTPTAYQDQLILSVIPNPDSLVACLAAVRQELELLAQPGYFSKNDLRAARRILRLQYAQRDDRSLDRLAAIGRAWARYAPNWASPEIPRANRAALEALSAALSPNQAHIAGLLVNSTLGSVTNLDSIFSAPLIGVVASVPEKDTMPLPPDPRPDLSPLTSYRIYFESSSFQADAPSLVILENLAQILEAYPTLNLFVNGYSDGQGDGVYNYQLSIQRAESVYHVLVDQYGIAPARLTVRGYGEAFAEYPDDTAEHMALNRRVSFEIAP